MTKSQNTEAIAKATNRSWEKWLEWLDGQGAKDLSHKEIAELVRSELEGEIESAGWWAQGVTVAYEQHIGRRMPGQRSDGTFEVSVNKDLEGSREEIFERVLAAVENQKEFNGQRANGSRQSITPVRSYWRCDLEDGSKLDFAIGPRSTGNFMLTISHAKIQSADLAESRRAYWKAFISKIS